MVYVLCWVRHRKEAVTCQWYRLCQTARARLSPNVADASLFASTLGVVQLCEKGSTLVRGCITRHREMAGYQIRIATYQYQDSRNLHIVRGCYVELQDSRRFAAICRNPAEGLLQLPGLQGPRA